jgi:hypothetical protein
MDDLAFLRILDVVFRDSDRISFVLFELYLDESGDDGGFPLMLVGGYLIRPEQARKLERDWAKLLNSSGLAHFHMVDCAHGNAQFSGMSKGKRVALQKKFFSLINKYVEVSLAVCVPLNHFKDDTDRVGPPYAACLNNCVILLQNLLDSKVPNWRASVFYESGHKHSADAIRLFDAAKANGHHGAIVSVESVDKRESGMIQAADIFAWQFATYVKGMVGGREVRKDFKVLLRKPGLYLHAFPIDGLIVVIQQFNDGLSHPHEKEKICSVYTDADALSQYMMKMRGETIIFSDR